MDRAFKQLQNAGACEDMSAPVALLATSTSIPRMSGIGYHEYYTDVDSWIRAHKQMMNRFPKVVWIPGPVYEIGLAVIAMAYGAKCRFTDNKPPEYEPIPLTLQELSKALPVNPYEQGLMPLVLANQLRIEKVLSASGQNRGFAYSWGPMSIIQSLTGMEELLVATLESPSLLKDVLEVMTESSINWIHAQLSVMENPSGIFIGDDITGLLSGTSCSELVIPYLTRIFNEFPHMLRIYHNDTPCMHLINILPDSGFDIWHFSHEIPMSSMATVAQSFIPMGNIPPLEIGMRGSVSQVINAARSCLKDANGSGCILSWGGSMAAETPLENIDAIISAASAKPQ